MNGTRHTSHAGLLCPFLCLVSLAFARVTPQEQAGSEPRIPTFEFHDVFWTNLHHFLFRQALAAREGQVLASATEEWTEAVAYYEARIIDRDLLFDEDLRAVDWTLGQAADAETLDGVELEGELGFVLESVAPLYRSALWKEHSRANQEWIALMQPLLKEHLRPIALRMAELFGEEWPKEAVRVDVLVYANWASAYTSDDPDHIRIGTTYSGDRSTTESFEILVHEAGHLLMGKILNDLLATAAEREAAVPRSLWHMVLFYTTGELVRQSAVSPADYAPYAFARGLYRGRNAPSLEAIESVWPAYMAGELQLEETIERLVEEFTPQPAGGRLRAAPPVRGGSTPPFTPPDDEIVLAS